MASRNILHKSKLEEFKNWIVADGWTIENHSANECAVLRARKDGRKHPLIVYEKIGAKEHYTVQERDISVVREFLKERKKI